MPGVVSHRVILMSTAMAAAMLVSTPAWSQNSPPSEGPRAANEEAAGAIVVTARRRVETVQDVPASISLVTAADLQHQNIVNVTDLSSAFSGVVVNNAPNNNAAVSVRGLGTPSASFGFDQSVSLFVDGVYAGRSRDYNTALFDASRVELLRGTQTAILGKNTSLGAISVVSREPGREFSFNGSLTHELELGSTTADIGVDVPVTDTLAIRVASQLADQKRLDPQYLHQRKRPLNAGVRSSRDGVVEANSHVPSSVDISV